ncbi:hypothetical protein HR060_04490 [Catenovulum sp. SM1970]|uniref:hypothetical protein n=1 Tax=Marinifaba aquimaris TaxID=2741323 RepID=UPI0015732EBE|nr:hypothetical protein [Marinifaba aquimaris]NTS76120.1 hypothetical protein [Marinifaba aquimaris]
MMKLKMAIFTALFATTLSASANAPDQFCYYEYQPVDVITIECEYEASFDYYGLPHYYVPPQTSCPSWATRKVSFEKDITKVETKVGVGYVPSCGSKWISYDWNGSHTVNGRKCDYWWREGANITGYEDKRTVRTETRRVRVCEDLR